MTKTAPATRNGTTWFLQFRKWHSWGGLVLSALILLVGVTGILLNHKKLFFRGARKNPTGLLRSTTNLDSVPVSFSQAMGLARRHYGDVALDKIELKDQGGRLVYKVSQGHGEEVLIDAHSGALSSKYGGSLEGSQETTLDWAKVVNDLHTGKILGTTGMLVVDVTAGVIIALTVTGIYLWCIPMLRKRHKRRGR